MEFSPSNHVVKLCVQGMGLAATGQPEKAGELYLQAWNDATNDFEKYIAAYFVARQQKQVSEQLNWFKTTLAFALKVDDVAVKSALPTLYTSLARCYADLGDHDSARQNRELAASIEDKPTDSGPFYHGTRADLQIGDLLTPGSKSNYDPDLTMNHIYFTALVGGAGLAAALALGDGHERVYVVEPTGDFENDPNVTDKKFPGNPTRSYRSRAPLKIIGEISTWERPDPQVIQRLRATVASADPDLRGEIIN